MSDFTSDAPTSSVSDLTKRVRYSTGLVLGVDEFNQDQAYFIERDRLLTRALHGYGVVQGLRPHLEVRSADSADEIAQIRLEPGLAIVPSGQHVCIDRPQCAVVRDWLAQQDPSTVFPSYESNGEAGANGGSGSNGGGGSPPDVEAKEVCISVVLRYGTCETDFVPIPGEPCRSAEESKAASRMADDFRLALAFEENRPPQVEEHAIRLLGRLLRALQVRPSGPYVLDGGLDLNGLVTALPGALSSVDDPAKASIADLEKAAGETLPTDENGDPLLRVKPGQETKVLRALETAWVRDTRRTLLKTGHAPKKNPLEVGRGTDGRCQPVPKGDDGIVLGTLCLAVEPREKQGSNGTNGLKPAPQALTENGILNTRALQVSTDDRPRLLSSRVLQETGGFDRVEPGSDADAPDTLSIEEVADTLPTLPFATAELIDPVRLPSVEASAEEVAVRIRFHLNTHETVTTRDNAYDVGEDFNVQVFSERSDPMTDYLYLTKESVQDRARLGRNVYVLLLRKTSVQNRPHLRLRFDLSDMRINRRAANGDGTRGEVTETVSGTEWVEERPVKWVGHDGTRHVTVFASGRAAGGDLEGLHAAPRVAGLQGTSVAPDAPAEGDRLVYDGTDWRPEAASVPQPEPVATNAETGLTRLVALNWPHGGVYRAEDSDVTLPTVVLRSPPIAEEERRVQGLAVAFGETVLSADETLSTGTEHDIQADTLTRETFRVQTRQGTGGAARLILIQPRAVLPLQSVRLGDDGKITEGRASPAPDRAVGALFLFPDRLADAPSELGGFDVRIRGDGITDVSGRAVDAEFVRGALPTGDRPSRHDAGVQGGTFESWFSLTEPSTPSDIDVLNEIFGQNSR
jgi:hypothetical protein